MRDFDEATLGHYIQIGRHHEDVNPSILDWITDFLYRSTDDEDIIERFRNTFRAGYCYFFAQMLKAAFPTGEVCWAAPFGHFIFLYDGVPYDVEGVYDGEAYYYIPETFIPRTYLENFLHIDGRSGNAATREDLIHIIKTFCKVQNIEYSIGVEELMGDLA